LLFIIFLFTIYTTGKRVREREFAKEETTE